MSAAKEEAALLKPACANIRIVNIEFYEWLALKEKIMFPQSLVLKKFGKLTLIIVLQTIVSNLLSVVSFCCFVVITLSLSSLDIVSVDKSSKGSCA